MWFIFAAIKISIMKKLSLLIIVLSTSIACYAQTFLNGDFEINTAVNDQINLTNSAFNGFMSNSFAFGDYGGGGAGGGDMDIITSATYCGVSQNENWYVALTSGGTDAFSLTLSAPLITGHSYTMTFYDRVCASIGMGSPIIIGVSNVNDSFGNLVYTAPPPVVNGGWTQRVFSFIAPINGLYVTISCNGVNSGTLWTQVDNFSLIETTSIQTVNNINTVSIYPNPANNSLNIQTNNNLQATIIIYDFASRKILEREFINTITLNTELLSKGIYLYEIKNNNAVVKKGKMVKE